MNAPRWKRMIAAGIDAVILLVMGLLITLVTGAVEDAEAYVGNQLTIRILGLAVLTYVLLNGYLLISNGQTVGKRLLGIKIIDAAGGRPALWRLALRAGIPFLVFCGLILPIWLIPLALIDVLWIFAPQKRCLHDLALGTYVANTGDH